LDQTRKYSILDACNLMEFELRVLIFARWYPLKVVSVEVAAAVAFCERKIFFRLHVLLVLVVASC
jgi:hypothetical protein